MHLSSCYHLVILFTDRVKILLSRTSCILMQTHIKDASETIRESKFFHLLSINNHTSCRALECHCLWVAFSTPPLQLLSDKALTWELYGKEHQKQKKTTFILKRIHQHSNDWINIPAVWVQQLSTSNFISQRLRLMQFSGAYGWFFMHAQELIASKRVLCLLVWRCIAICLAYT